jgi:ribosome-associated protein
LRGLSTIADYFVICSGESTTQVKAIEEQIEETLKKEEIRPIGIEGLRNSQWILMDYGDVIVHIFEESTRAYYELEKLWIDAEKINL